MLILRDAAIWRWDLNGESFGSTLPNEDPDGDGLSFVFNMRFPGQIYDSINAHTYVDSNPFLFTDRLGLEKDQACLAGYTAMGAACGGTLGYSGGGVSGYIRQTKTLETAGAFSRRLVLQTQREAFRHLMVQCRSVLL